MLRSRRNRLATLVGVALTAAACGTTEPIVEAGLDTEAALADYEALGAALQSSEFEGFQAFAARTPFGGTPAGTGLVAALEESGRADGGRAFALALLRRAELLLQARVLLHEHDPDARELLRRRGPAPAARSVGLHFFGTLEEQTSGVYLRLV